MARELQDYSTKDIVKKKKELNMNSNTVIQNVKNNPLDGTKNLTQV